MHWTIEEVPWGNLWRTAVTTYLFFLVLAMPIAFLTDLDGSDLWIGLLQAFALLAFVLASIVVWSERISWIGDPEPGA